MNTNNSIRNGDAMSGNKTTGARRRRGTKTAVWLGVAGLCAGGATLIPLGSHTQAAPGDPMTEGMVCTDGTFDASTSTRSFSLVATDGYTSEPDGNAIYDWGYGDGSKSGAFQLPGPVLCATQGEMISVTLTNMLPVNTSIQFPGQVGVTVAGQPDGPQVDNANQLMSLATEALPNGNVTYTFVADQPGTYLYESGSDPQLQVQMGLFGALVVRPANVTITAEDILAIPYDDGTGPDQTNADAGMTIDDARLAQPDARCAYPSKTGEVHSGYGNPAIDGTLKCDPLSIYDGGVSGDGSVKGENILMLSEIDPGLHTFMEQHLGTPAQLNFNAYPRGYEAHYFMINGRSMPDTVAPNNAPWLPSQPYGSLAHVQPWDPKANPLDAMLRYVGVGNAGYDFHPHSNHEHVIAQDGSLMRGATTNDDNTEEKFNIMVAPGSTVDATFRWTNQDTYADTPGHRVPVAWPQGLNMQEGDFWSGSPYLGDSGVLNPGILSKTQCGEYYHVAHNHDLTMVTNYGITFGGMLTLIKVEPPDSAGLGGCD